MRAYLLGYNHGTNDGYFSTLIERGGCEKPYDESLDKEYVPIDDVLESINKRIEWCREQYNRGEHIADVYALALVREDILTLKGEQDGD